MITSIFESYTLESITLVIIFKFSSFVFEIRSLSFAFLGLILKLAISLIIILAVFHFLLIFIAFIIVIRFSLIVLLFRHLFRGVSFIIYPLRLSLNVQRCYFVFY